MSSRPQTWMGARQAAFDELGTPLRLVDFVVVDLETTGGSAESCDITEIGAVRVRGGEVLGEFQSLVRPTAPIPPFIAVLTGISDSLVASSPRIASVLPAFLEFAGGSVLVAHNAPFDVGFLRRNAERLGVAWPSFGILDTARLARRALSRDEAPNCKLSTLARLFRTEHQPCHRALADARATVGVLHGLMERVAGLGVVTLEELSQFSQRVPDQVRRKRHLAEPLDHGPGVYIFRDAQGEPLYVGTATDLRTRVRSYFTAAETRRRMAEMVALAERVDAIPCPTVLEAQVRELRLITALQPRYNRRSRHTRGQVWVRLTQERFPRLSVVRAPPPQGEPQLGPFGSRARALAAVEALQDAVPVRSCTLKLGPRTVVSACLLAGLGRCGAPCDGSEDTTRYDEHVQRAQRAIREDPGEVVDALTARIGRLAAAQRYEEAAGHRDRLAAFVLAAARRQRLDSLLCLDELVAARPQGGGWSLAVVRRGRLAATSVAPRGEDPMPRVEAVIASAEIGDPEAWTSAEETEVVLRWLELPGTRLVRVSSPWCQPAFGAGRFRQRYESVGASTLDPFHDRRGLRPEGPA